MKLVLRYVFLSGIVIALQSIVVRVYSQNIKNRCGTVAYNQSRYPDPLQQKIHFEKWLGEQIARQRSGRGGREQAAPYKVPVVVHVIHNGEAIGVGTNISDAQILSQMKVLNDDFNRLNADAVNTPAGFAGVAGSLDIEFILARQDPDGLATDGIVRVNGGRTSWTMNDNYQLKELSYWRAEEYLNVWVCNLNDAFVGYAQFPESTLPGLQNSSTNRLTDGVVIWYRAFGSVDDGNFSLDPDFNKGRTLTHEMGHFFGLNHIWGDENGCVGTDYVDDTPNQAGSTDGCPTHPRTDACGEVIMFQNYLDYSNDACMNLFTQGQVDRMTIVIDNSPRRNSLLTSPGLTAPAPGPNDLGIRNIVSPDATVCSNSVTPLIEVRNYGSNSITTASIKVSIDGGTNETIDFPLTLDPGESVNLPFSDVSLPSGEHNFTFEILSTNGVADGQHHNDSAGTAAILPSFISPPFFAGFDTPPPGWIIQNPDGQIAWEITTAPRETPDNKALQLRFYDYEDKIGEIDRFISPVIDLSTAEAATLTFDVAYARFQSSNDRLKVVALVDCEDISSGTVVYDKAGDALHTAPPTSNPFTPSGVQQWRKELIDLSAFLGAGKLQLAFVGINDWGNNVYLDNIAFFTAQTVDVSLLRLTSPSPVTCDDGIFPKVLVRNVGSVPLLTFDLTYSLNNVPPQTINVDDVDIGFGQEKEIDLPALAFSDGLNNLSVSISDPNGLTDIVPGDNDGTYTIVVNKAADRIPLRQNFDQDYSAWTIVNPKGGMDWKAIATNYNRSMYFNAFNNTFPGDEAWLVSPVLDFSAANQASLLFDLSGVETLRILTSTDCGNSFQETSYNFPAGSSGQGLPVSADDWMRNVPVNLNALAGEENVRVAFVVANQQGNNLYLDNIEFFTTADPDAIEIDEAYSIYGYDLSDQGARDLRITFNLPEKENVQYTVINTAGQIKRDVLLNDVLNQTFPLEVNTLASGMYFVRLRIGDRYFTTKILIN